MEEVIFSLECQAEGVPLYYGQRVNSGALYRWEPMATRMRWGEVSRFRRKLAERSVQGEASRSVRGILPVAGPVPYQGQALIGWEVYPGESLFANFPPAFTLEEGLAALEPLVNSYTTYHQQGLTVGCPDWHRVYLGGKGISMPDPYSLSYLATPQGPLPKGLSACHPPEIYTNQPLNQSGDLFYLGLLCYLVLTGHLPYPLVQGWPTEALRQGVIIPPTRWQPELSAEITRHLEKLLAADPQERPSAEELSSGWRQMNAKRRSGAPLKKENNRPWRWQVRLFWRLHRRRAEKYLLACTGVVLLVILFGWGLRAFPQERNVPPAQAIMALFSAFADPSYPAYLLDGSAGLWLDLLAAKEERKTAITALMDHPLLEVAEISILGQAENTASFEVKLVWHHWQAGHWQTVATRERIRVVRNRTRWVITEREQIN